MERKLAAIFSADVKGYSRLMGEDEEATIRTLTTYRAVLTTHIQQQHGRVVDSPGDNLLAEFASVVDAVRCAVAIQQDLHAHNAELPEQRKMEFRIGINLGDVVAEGERLYGDGVNIAARIESLAEPGGLCLSGTVYDQVETKLPLTYEDLGEQAVKNIAKPVRVWRVVMDAAAAVLAEQVGRRPLDSIQDRQVQPRPGRATSRNRVVLIGAGLVLLIGGIMTVHYLARPSHPPQSAGLSPAAAPAALPLPDKPSIVVLPFVNMSKDPEQEYFSDGLTETLTGDLSKISSLFVIARNSAFTYKGKAAKVQDVGREMGVRYVLEGSVQKSVQRIRITVQLIDATTGYHLWSEQYDRPLTDIFTLQDEIVQKIVTTLKLQLTLQEQGWIVRKQTNNLEAYDAFLRGVEYFSRYTKETIAQTRQLYEKAIALDPQYADAYAWLSYSYWREWVSRLSTDPQTLERALTLVQQALALDDSLPIAHSLLGYVLAQQQQYDQAIAEEERAIALDPNNADSYARQADVLNLAGRSEDALRSMEQAMRLNPHYPPWYLVELGVAYHSTGRYAEAIAVSQEAIERNPNQSLAHGVLVHGYLMQWLSQQSPAAQTLEPAVVAGQRAVALNDSWFFSHITLGYLYLYQRQYERALAEMERAVALTPTDAWSYAARAEVLSCMGRVEDALAAAAQALLLKPQFAEFHLGSGSVGPAYAMAGRYEEAITPLKQYLSRYPNRLDIHLMLAAVYSELGHATEARGEAAEVLRLNPQFSLELHKQRMPIKDPAVLERHIAALRKAELK